MAWYICTVHLRQPSGVKMVIEHRDNRGILKAKYTGLAGGIIVGMTDGKWREYKTQNGFVGSCLEVTEDQQWEPFTGNGTKVVVFLWTGDLLIPKDS